MKEIITRVEFEVKSALIIADPCYIDKDDVEKGIGTAIDSLGLLLPDCEGKWVAETGVDFNGRVVFLKTTKIGSLLALSMTLKAVASVDSGQMFIGCASMFGLDYEELLERYKLPNGEDNELQFFGFGEGVVSGTTYGDGDYPVHVYRNHINEIAKVEVHFNEDENDKGDNDW